MAAWLVFKTLNLAPGEGTQFQFQFRHSHPPPSSPYSLGVLFSMSSRAHHHHHYLIIYPSTVRVVGVTVFSIFPLFSTALWDLPNSRPVHSLMLSSNLFLGLPCLLPPFTVPCKRVLARPDKRETWPYHRSLCLFPMVERSSCGPIACWILARTSSLEVFLVCY